MTDRPPLNPPATPLCRDYNVLYFCWEKANKRDKDKYWQKIEHHRATCPMCQKRMAEMTELARNAVHPLLPGKAGEVKE